MAAHRAIARAAYKGLLKAARRLDGSGAAAWEGEKSVIASIGSLPPPVAAAVAARSAAGASLTETVRAAFRAGAAAPAPADGLLDAAIKALSVVRGRALERAASHALAVTAAAAATTDSQANKRVATLAGAASPIAAPASPAAAVAHRMGVVMRHKVLGYRCVGCAR